MTFVWARTGSYVANDHRRVASMVRYAAAAGWVGLRHRPAPDVIIGSSPQPLAALSASAVARIRKVPWVFEVRDIWPSALVDMGAIPGRPEPPIPFPLGTVPLLQGECGGQRASARSAAFG